MLIIGNWKMNGTPLDVAALESIAETARAAPATEVVICPPFTMLTAVAGTAGLKCGAQDCHEADAGAFTGCVSAPMIKAAGADYVLVGHSERRRLHSETNEVVVAKATAAIRAALIPVICVGETASERAAGDAYRTVNEQLRAVIRTLRGDIVVAYEPVWAIGTGNVPSVRDVQEMMARLGSMLREGVGLDAKLVYGGSVGAANAAAFLQVEHVSGVLLGGASLRLEEMRQIINVSSSGVGARRADAGP